MATLSNGLLVVMSGAASFVAFYSTLKLGKNERIGITYLAFSAALTISFIGNALSLLIDYTPLSDSVILAAYVLAIIAGFYLTWDFRDLLSPKRIVLIVFSGVLILVVSLLAVVPLPSGMNSLEVSLALMFPVLNSIMLSVALGLAVLFWKGDFAKAWMSFAIGLLLFGVAGAGYAAGMAHGGMLGIWVDLFWLWGYLAIVTGFRETRSLQA